MKNYLQAYVEVNTNLIRYALNEGKEISLVTGLQEIRRTESVF